MNIEKINGEKIQIAEYVYEGVLFIRPEPTPTLSDTLNALAASYACWHIEFVTDYFFINYKGEDRQRRTLKFLRKVAPLIGNTSQEIVCFLFPQNIDDPRIFVEFLTIKNGKLRRQRAEVKRKGKSKVVTQKMLNAVKCLR